MALLSFLPEITSQTNAKKQKPSSNKPRKKQKQHQQQKKDHQQTSSWDQIKNLLTCKQIDTSTTTTTNNSVAYSKLSSCSSICSFRDVVHGSTRVVHRADNSPENSTVGQETGTILRKTVHNNKSGTGLANSSRSTSSLASTTSMRSNGGGSTHRSTTSKGMQFRKLSGCYECHMAHMIVDPSRYPTPRTICSCPDCGEVFPKIESLELHQAVRHAVSELGPEDSGRNIVEIIFKSSWLKKDNPICTIDRILKVHNTKRTIQRFEDCRDAVKLRANSTNTTKKDPRCAADGNELLRFHCASLTCSLGSRGSTGLCGSVPSCGVCTIIRHGFQGNKPAHVGATGKGVRTMASSGRAHDCLDGADNSRAMLVCRVIAGRVRRVVEDAPSEEESAAAGWVFDSVAGYVGVYSNLEELHVFNPRAILPCFVVIYKTTL